MRKQATGREEIFAEDLSDKGLLVKIHNKLSKLNNEKMNKPINKCTKDLKRCLTERPGSLESCQSQRAITANLSEFVKSRARTPTHTGEDMEEGHSHSLLVGI